MKAENAISPFWGIPTANSNFCEEDYLVTRYIAEFINSLSNIAYIFYAIYGVRKLSQKRHVDFFRALPYWGLFGVGVCSCIYHLTLHYHTQMLDDLSMHLTTIPVLHRVLTVDASRGQSIKTAFGLAVGLSVFVVYHVLTDELLIHSTLFVVSVAIIGWRTAQLINVRTRADSIARRRIWGIVRFGALIFNVGFWVWLIDGWTCGFLRDTRHAIGLPWAFFLELHGWWHIFTAIGAYVFIDVVDCLISSDDPEAETFAWPASWAGDFFFAGSKKAEARKNV